jgi:hypothetical protein
MKLGFLQKCPAALTFAAILQKDSPRRTVTGKRTTAADPPTNPQLQQSLFDDGCP